MAVIDLDKPDGTLRIEKAIRLRISGIKRELAFEFYRLAALNTPVDTGRGRWGWYMSVGSPSDEVPPEGQYGFPDVADHGGGALDNITVDGTLYITNNVGYLVYVNNGTRYIAPRRFVERAISQFQVAAAVQAERES